MLQWSDGLSWLKQTDTHVCPLTTKPLGNLWGPEKKGPALAEHPGVHDVED